MLAIFEVQNTLKSLLYPQICELSASVRPEVRSSIVLNITGEKNEPKPFLWQLWHLKMLILAIFSLKHIGKSHGSTNSEISAPVRPKLRFSMVLNIIGEQN